jgi:hypothetical protein
VLCLGIVLSSANLPQDASDFQLLLQFLSIIDPRERARYSGLQSPEEGDHIAVIIGASRVAPPYRWLQTVIDSYYDVGLRIFAKCYDPGNIDDGGEIGPYDVFYSVPASDCEFTLEGSQHCAARSVDTQVSGT